MIEDEFYGTLPIRSVVSKNLEIRVQDGIGHGVAGGFGRSKFVIRVFFWVQGP